MQLTRGVWRDEHGNDNLRLDRRVRAALWFAGG